MVMPPMPDLCAVCGCDIERHEHTTPIGEDHAHAQCADDRLHVRSCCYCSELVLVGEDGLWAECSDGWWCPTCAADQEPETVPAERDARATLNLNPEPSTPKYQ